MGHAYHNGFNPTVKLSRRLGIASFIRTKKSECVKESELVYNLASDGSREGGEQEAKQKFRRKGRFLRATDWYSIQVNAYVPVVKTETRKTSGISLS